MSPDFHNSSNLQSHQFTGGGLPEPFETWSGSPTEYPRDNTVATLFEEVVSQYPRNVALVFQGTELTYADLNARADHLARQLRQMGVGPEVMVGCSFERSPEFIVSVLAVLKAGGAYVPLDPFYPKDRLDLLLEDTRAPLILTQKLLASTTLSGCKSPLLVVDGAEDLCGTDESSNGVVAPSAAGPKSLACVMYTSGSTGRPKGVMVENRSIVRLVRNTNYCRFAPDEVFLQFAPISFDASTFEIFGPLLNGGRLVIAPPQKASLEDLGALIRGHGVTTLWLTAGLFHLMVEQRIEDLRPLRQLLAGGDVLSPAHVQTFLQRLPHCALINGYGPTENTTFTCCHLMRADHSNRDSVPIGRPIANTQVFILDQHLRPVSPGVTGELFAAGDGLARGYLNDPEATDASFLKNPFAKVPDGRMYRTGDLARWRSDGTIEFVGRADNQVKVSGYRIEPGEIETILGKHHGVKLIYVVPQANGHGSKRLVAFYVPSEYQGVSPQLLREFAAEKLPQYMVPAHFIALSSIPLSPNGKVDRAALSRMDVAINNTQSSEIGQTHLERDLQSLWCRILRISQAGLDDNFFDLGGDSLLLVAVHSNLQKMLSLDISITDLFEFTTIRKLARHIAEKEKEAPSLSAVQQQAYQQREAFARFRQQQTGNES